MIETKLFTPPISLFSRTLTDGILEISRLLAAAVVNPQFCHLLLNDPALALQTGYQGEDFYFSDDERDQILSIRADSLADLADQLARTFNKHLQIPLNSAALPAVVFGY
jgi:hypothetical protein